MDFGNIVKRECNRQNISVYELSKRTGISEGTIHRYIRGCYRSPSLYTAEAVLNGLGLELKVIYKDDRK